MARTSSTRKTTAKKTTTSSKTAAAKKTTTRPRTRKTTQAAAKPRLSLVKTIDLRAGLPTRPRDFVTDPQIYATYTARQAGLPVHRIRDWTPRDETTATRRLADGSLLHYSHDTRTLTWHTHCPMGAIHAYTLTTASTATAARIHANRCRTPHADLGHIPALTKQELAALGIHTGPTWARPDLLDETPTEVIPVVLPDRKDRALADQLTRTHADTTDTQPLNRDEIAAGLTARADHDTPKGHPQP